MRMMIFMICEGGDTWVRAFIQLGAFLRHDGHDISWNFYF